MEGNLPEFIKNKFSEFQELCPNAYTCQDKITKKEALLQVLDQGIDEKNISQLLNLTAQSTLFVEINDFFKDSTFFTVSYGKFDTFN